MTRLIECRDYGLGMYHQHELPGFSTFLAETTIDDIPPIFFMVTKSSVSIIYTSGLPFCGNVNPISQLCVNICDTIVFDSGKPVMIHARIPYFKNNFEYCFETHGIQ